MALIKWLPLLLMIAGTEEKEPWDYSVGEEMLKSILESCYGGNSSPNPVVIFGDFNKFINGVSIIQINDFLNVEDYKEHGSLKFKASSVVLMEEPSEQLLSNLLLLRETELWDNMVPFFIIGAKTAPCTNSRWILGTMWGLEVVRAIYICSKFINDGAGIYTLNPITNYAPYPWTKISEEHNLTIFYQNFDANISCTDLTYDKTEILSGYNIVAVGWALPGLGWVPGYNYFERYAQFSDVSIKALRTIIIALNASGQIEVETGMNSMKKRWLEGSADIMTILFTHHMFWVHPNLFPLLRNELVIVVKLKAEVSTLKKIHQLWSTPVLIATAFALAFLFLVLLIKRRSFGSALLDFTRFLIYTSIQTDNRYQSFRIYFTTMLIFIVISRAGKFPFSFDQPEGGH